MEFSLSNREERGTLCFLSQVEWTARGLTQKNAGFACSGLNLGSCYMSQDEGRSEYSMEIQEETLDPRLIWTGGLTSLDTSRELWSSRLQKLTRFDSS